MSFENLSFPQRLIRMYKIKANDQYTPEHKAYGIGRATFRAAQKFVVKQTKKNQSHAFSGLVM